MDESQNNYNEWKLKKNIILENAIYFLMKVNVWLISIKCLRETIDCGRCIHYFVYFVCFMGIHISKNMSNCML